MYFIFNQLVNDVLITPIQLGWIYVSAGSIWAVFVFSQGFTNQIVLVAYKQTIKVTDITLSTGFTDQIIPVICFNKCNKPIPGMGCPPNLIGQNTFGKKTW